MTWIAKSESVSHKMPKDTSNVTRGLNRTKLPFLGGYVAIGGRGCNLRENEGRSEIWVQMAILEMPQMAQNGPISNSFLFWVVTWPQGFEVAISRKKNQ